MHDFTSLQGTMEEKIYDRQVTKESLSMRVVDEKQIGRHFTASDLAELFTYSPAPLPDLSSGSKDMVKKPEVSETALCACKPIIIMSLHQKISCIDIFGF